MINSAPLYDPSGPFLLGVSGPEVDQLPAARAVAKATTEDEVVRLVDHYFSAVQYYGNRKSVSYWQKDTLVNQTQRIPYIRYGDNMRYVPPSELVVTMLERKPGVWVIRPSLWARLAPAVQGRAQIILEEGPWIVIRTGPTKT